jgi:hypothetical protein
MGPECSRRLRFPGFSENKHTKVQGGSNMTGTDYGLFTHNQSRSYLNHLVLRLSVVGTGLLYPTGRVPDTHFCQRLNRPQGHSTDGRIRPMKVDTL